MVQDPGKWNQAKDLFYGAMEQAEDQRASWLAGQKGTFLLCFEGEHTALTAGAVHDSFLSKVHHGEETNEHAK